MFDISKVLSEEGILVKALNARTNKNLVAIFDITIEINGKEQLEKIGRKLKSISGVREIERVIT